MNTQGSREFRGRLLLLSLGAFAIGTGSYAFLGVLASLARDLGVLVETAGQLAAVFALTRAVTSPFAVALTRRVLPRRLLLGSMGVFVTANAAAVLAPNFTVLLFSLGVAALRAGVYVPVACYSGLSPFSRS